MKKHLFISLAATLCLHIAHAQLDLTVLKQQAIEMGIRINRYDFDRFNLLTQTIYTRTETPGNYRIFFEGTEWEATLTSNPVEGKKHSVDIKAHFKLVKGNLSGANVSIELTDRNWSMANYVLLPAAAYNGNRFDWRRIAYSPKLLDPKDIGPDKPTIVTDIPKLNKDDGPSRIQERSGSMSTPAIGYRSANSHMGYWLLTTQGNHLGDYGMGIEETRDRRQAMITVSSPLVRELYKYRITDNRYPSDDHPGNFKEGDTLSIAIRLYDFYAPEIQTLYDTFAHIRKDLSGTKTGPNTLPYSACMNLIEEKFNTLNYVPEYGYYAVGTREFFLQDWQIGWTGGMISTYPLLFEGKPTTRQNVLKNFDWLFPNGIAPSGFFWDSGEKGTQWYGGDIRKPHTKNWHLVRKSGDGLYYILKQFGLMEKMQIDVKPSWREGTRKVADAFVRLWNHSHQFGNFVDSQTGEVVVGGSTSGAIVPAALVLAAKYYSNPDYLRVAKESGIYFYELFVKQGLTTGGPGDALQNPDSESCYALVESYITLYEATGEKIWLDYAGAVARQFSTWVMSYDFRFPASSTMSKIEAHSTGAVGANTQNKHGAPNICTHSGAGLLKLYRATGDTWYLALLRDIAHNQTQYLSQPDRPIADLPIGWMSERVSTTDWLEGIGEVAKHTTWAETALMLSVIEIPGIYVLPDKQLVYAFDNVNASIVKNTTKEITVAVSNTTRKHARVKVLSENSKERAKPLGQNYLYGANSVELKPGETKLLLFKK